MAVGAAGAAGVAEQRRLRRLLRRDAVEDRAVADVVPGDEPREARPGRGAGEGAARGNPPPPVARRELEALQGRQDVLVGHRGQAEARAAVAEIATVVDLG